MKQIVCITAGCMFFALMLSACRTPATQLKEEQNMGNQMIIETPVRGGSAAVSSPRVFVYKTKGDYSHLVPVLMDDSRTQILSYPHPRDLFIGGKLCLPTLLNDGYWLDNRGIGRNVAFLSYTYEEYSRLSSAPSMEEHISEIKTLSLNGMNADGGRTIKILFPN